MNIDSVDRTIRALEHSRSFDQGRWFHRRLRPEEGPQCWTPACVAGHTLTAHNFTYGPVKDKPWLTIRDPDGAIVVGSITQVAGDLLGFTALQRELAFQGTPPIMHAHRDEGTTRFWDADPPDAAMAIGMLQRAKETGRIEWREEDRWTGAIGVAAT